MNVFTKTAIGISLAVGLMSSAMSAELSRGDQKFLKTAAESGMFEIQASKLTAQNAQSQEVKDFGQMMVTDHTKVDGELKALASAKGFALPTELPRGKQKSVEELSKKSGHDFDKAYASDIAVDAHEDAVEAFKDASEDAKDADIKAFAAKTLPSLQAHLEKGRSLEKTVDSMKK